MVYRLTWSTPLAWSLGLLPQSTHPIYQLTMIPASPYFYTPAPERPFPVSSMSCDTGSESDSASFYSLSACSQTLVDTTTAETASLPSVATNPLRRTGRRPSGLSASLSKSSSDEFRPTPEQVASMVSHFDTKCPADYVAHGKTPNVYVDYASKKRPSLLRRALQLHPRKQQQKKKPRPHSWRASLHLRVGNVPRTISEGLHWSADMVDDGPSMGFNKPFWFPGEDPENTPWRFLRRFGVVGNGWAGDLFVSGKTLAAVMEFDPAFVTQDCLLYVKGSTFEGGLLYYSSERDGVHFDAVRGAAGEGLPWVFVDGKRVDERKGMDEKRCTGKGGFLGRFCRR